MMQMPPSMQAQQVTINYCWNMDSAYENMAKQVFVTWGYLYFDKYVDWC
jgi:hypothetical protein